MLSNPLASSSLSKRKVWKRYAKSTTSLQRSFLSKILRPYFLRFQEKLYWRRRKYCEQKSVKFEGNVALLMRVGPFFYDERKARQDVYLNCNALSKSYKIQVTKVATKRQF